ncbi:MAG TPA: WYL domain-containing protein [Gemmatimonadales bacterium]|nr:WYL domain-containing protein [Gemmatimonadales bacterium]
MSEQEARASWSARVDDELTGAERLVVAILDHRLVRFRYHGHERTVEPHLLGLHEAGEPLLVAYQTGGGSESGQIPGWRSFITTSIEDVVIDDHHFPGPRGDLAVDLHRMIEIFARA